MNLQGPLRRPAFRRLTAAYAVDEIGDWLGIVALALLVLDRGGTALAVSGLFLATRFLPSLLGPLLVIRIERWRPRISMPVLYMGEAICFAALAYLATNFSLPLVIVIAALDGVLALANRAVIRAVAAALLEPHGELRAGNAVLNIAFTGGAAAGPAIAAAIIAGLSIEAALLLDAASFMAIAILMAFAPLPQPSPDEGGWRQRLRAGVAYIRQTPSLGRLLTLQGAAFIFFAAVIPVEVIYAKDTLGAGDGGYGVLLASWGAGMVIGSLLFARLRGRELRGLLGLSTLAVGVAYLGLAAAPGLGLACAASVLGGAGNGVQWVSLVSAVQELTKQAMQARVLSVLESIATAMPGVGYLAGGLVTQAHDPRATFLVAGIGVLAVVACAGPLLARTRWRGREAASGRPALDAAAAARLDVGVGGVSGVPPG